MTAQDKKCAEEKNPVSLMNIKKCNEIEKTVITESNYDDHTISGKNTHESIEEINKTE